MLKKSIFLLAALFLWNACNSDDACEAPPTYASITRAPLTQASFEGDTRQFQAYEEIGRILESGRRFEMGVYTYQALRIAQDLFDALGVKAQDLGYKAIVGQSNDWEYSIDKHSGFFAAVSVNEMHSMLGIEPDAIYSDDAYLQRALQWQRDFDKDALNQQRVSVYPYKIRKYTVADNPDHERISQIAVSFASIVDGWPIMGSAKTAVHFSPNKDMKIIGYTQNRRVPAKLAFRLSQDDLLQPKEALALVYHHEKLDPNSVELLRSEFGYLDAGKHSARELLSPYYSYVFKSKHGSKLLHRSISAVKNDRFAQIIAKDEARDITRKSTLTNLDKGDIKDAK
ncbi:MAG: hypothetical protein ACOX8U_09995 [Bradymonadia bacterium]|jgi:hypothetical protein